ncbi:MAG: hypothetical protein RBS76_01925 [Acholeplasmatales bacterium]|jgi:hypothetical protein|nr:hypothetical protein [Acholeplasmataceae bacterium]MDY0115239.1 hypothetical protein [Acholeplasmatales bacterium]MCK9233890.1 hypothetical protein [Acholeplasmataceae bacterium]MCK9289423.1 hypothetical protein [Acholeplasmataceae bacterium]MCK9427830.1 hypothetical protein [Acholeplasmataceae bacterium]
MNSKQVIKKYQSLVITFFSIIVIFIVAMMIVAFKVDDNEKMTMINLILMVVLLVISLLFRTVLLGYKYMAGIARVVLKQGKPINFYNNLDSIEYKLIQKGYQKYANNENYQILYYQENIVKKKVFRTKRLYVVILIKDQTIDFYDKNLHDEITALQELFPKKERANQYLFNAFKSFNNIYQEDIKALSEVVSYGAGKQFFTQINIGLNKSDKKAYFLYSDDYYPSTSYKDCVELIKTIIS